MTGKELEHLKKVTASIDELFDFRPYVFQQAYEGCAKRPEDLEADWKSFCKADVDVVVKTYIGKKWGKKLDFDYDDSLVPSYIFWKTLFPDVEDDPIEQRSEIKSGLEYHLKFNGMLYRGDTMNSWYRTLNEFARQCGSPYLLYWNGKYIPAGYGSWEEFLSQPQNYQKPFPGYIQEFIKVVYTIGNFAIVPREGDFNQKRNRVFNDYWDLTLQEIFRYYKGEECHPIFQEEGVEEWLEIFKGWDDFVKRNFMQPFVQRVADGSFGEPLELWDNHFSGMPQTEGDFEQFFVNARIRILERGKLVVAALKEKLLDTERENKKGELI